MCENHRPRVLYLAHRVPYPPDKGDRIRNFHILSWLATRASVDLACLADERIDEGAVKTLEAMASRVAAIRIGATQRWTGAVWSFARGRTVSEGAFHSNELQSLLRRWVTENRYRAILVSSSSLVPYLGLLELQPLRAVVDFVDVDSQKWFDYARSCRGPRAWLYRAEGRRLQRLERDATTRAHAVILVSEAETNLFAHTCDAPNVHTVANGVDLATFHPCVEAKETAGTCVFVGALDYLPNVDGVCWFCREVWPHVYQRRSGARLLLVGRRPVQAVRRLAAVPGVEVVGQVPDVRPNLAEAAVVVVPLRLARGVQNKVLEALAMGKATVASPQSLVGLAAHGAVPVLTAATRAEWVDALVRLLDDPTERRRLGSDGRRYVEEHHRWDRCLDSLDWILGLSTGPRRGVAHAHGVDLRQ
jgi:polysaccharide biosynthesis protein PslH